MSDKRFKAMEAIDTQILNADNPTSLEPILPGPSVNPPMKIDKRKILYVRH